MQIFFSSSRVKTKSLFCIDVGRSENQSVLTDRYYADWLHLYFLTLRSRIREPSKVPLWFFVQWWISISFPLCLLLCFCNCLALVHLFNSLLKNRTITHPGSILWRFVSSELIFRFFCLCNCSIFLYFCFHAGFIIGPVLVSLDVNTLSCI
jgi:hypothetical protein